MNSHRHRWKLICVLLPGEPLGRKCKDCGVLEVLRSGNWRELKLFGRKNPTAAPSEQVPKEPHASACNGTSGQLFPTAPNAGFPTADSIPCRQSGGNSLASREAGQALL